MKPVKTMHPSMQRLLDFVAPIWARAKFVPEGIAAYSLAVPLQASDQTIHNWMVRGISGPGALAAEAEFGCSACWLMTGVQPPGWAANPEPLPLKKELLDRLGAAPAEERWKAENTARLNLGMPLLPALENSKAA